MEVRNRNEMNPEYQWKLEDIFKTAAVWEEAFQTATDMTDQLLEIAGTLTQSKEKLKDGLDRIYQCAEQVEKVYLYAMLRKSGDNGDAQAQEMESRAMNLYVRYSAAVSFVDPEILSIDDETMKAWLQDPLLAEYHHILEDIDRQRPFTLSKDQEKMLSLLTDVTGTPDNVFTMLESVDMTFPDIAGENGETLPLTHGSYEVYRSSADRKIREKAFEAYFGEFKRLINTIAAAYTGSVKADNYMAKVRGYGSALERSLAGNNVPVSVYDSLTETVRKGLGTMERYLMLRRKLLGVDVLHMYDLYCPIVEPVQYDLSLDGAKDLVKKALMPLGEEYQSLLDRAFRENWMDVYENKGKTTGAFSCGVYGVHPFVLLNFTGTLDDVFTIAHELGHSMHSYFSSRENSYANHDYRILVAEVASTVNENLLTQYLLKHETEPHRRAYILNHFLESFRTTVFRQTLFAEFERTVHEMDQNGVPLTADSMSRVYRELNEAYYRGVEVDPLQDIEWARVPHFYNAYYVYQYATGFCSAVAIANRILKTGDPSDYFRFLSSGGSDYPLEELKIAGIDLTRPEVTTEALEVFDQTLSELELILGVES